MQAGLSNNEAIRLEALRQYQILDTDPEEAFDDLTRLAAYICGTPVALVSLIDANRQWVKSKIGWNVTETPRNIAFCNQAILQPNVFVVTDALKDERFATNPLVTSEPYIRFYAGVPLVTLEGQALGMLCVMDYEPRELEPQQVEALRVLGRQVITQLEAQFLRAQRLESIGTLASGIAHDLNNVLGPIMMVAELLQENISDKWSQQLLTELEVNVKRGASLVKQVLSFVRGIEGKRTIFQVKHLISEIKQIVKQTFPKSIEIHTDISPTLWTISADATQLHQVLMNLCINSRDAMPDGGTLTISAENLFIDENSARRNLDARVGPYVVVTVSDTGTGIPPEIVDRIFEPFFTTKELGKGTGLGLSTVIGIIKSHGGFVNVYSEFGQGIQFKVYLPAVEETQTQQAEDIELLTGQGELILVVDDELAICEITKTSLETYNYKVLTASDGIKAIALYAQHKDEISSVLMDMMMPSMDGPTAIRTLRKINPQVKIIAVSGLASSDKVATAMHTGVKAFLSKPYTVKELLNTINAVKSAN